MKKCDAIDFIAYLEGDDPDGSAERHISRCSHCRQELETYRKLIRGMIISHDRREGPCHRRQKVVAAALGEAEMDSEHLASCPSCKKIY